MSRTALLPQWAASQLTDYTTIVFYIKNTRGTSPSDSVPGAPFQPDNQASSHALHLRVRIPACQAKLKTEKTAAGAGPARPGRPEPPFCRHPGRSPPTRRRRYPGIETPGSTLNTGTAECTQNGCVSLPVHHLVVRVRLPRISRAACSATILPYTLRVMTRVTGPDMRAPHGHRNRP